jgi:thiaminase
MIPAVGNRIAIKSDAGTYAYEHNDNHRLLTVTPSYAGSNQFLTYTAFGKVATISDTGAVNKQLSLEYGVDEQRFKTMYEVNDTVRYTRYFYDTYEKEITPTGTRHLNYVYAGGSLVCIIEQQTGVNKKYP